MLPRLLRMHKSKDFRRTTRRGLRASRPTLIVHAMHAPDDAGSKDAGSKDAGSKDPMVQSGLRIGFVVSGAVGNAVTRNRVKRRLRHLAAAHVADTPVGLDRRIDIVVRALPRAATVPEEVPEDFGSAWYEVVSRLSPSRPAQSGGAR